MSWDFEIGTAGKPADGISGKRTTSVVSLERFIQELHHGYGLSPEEARKRVKDNLVEILMYDQHSSNGLLLTDDRSAFGQYH